MKNTPDIYDKIRQLIASVPAGNVATYGQIAKTAGLKNGARAVAYALRTTPANLSIPWHRIINSQGRSSFPAGSPHYKKQLRLLLSEGIEISNHKISLARFGWQSNLDAVLWRSPY